MNCASSGHLVPRTKTALLRYVLECVSNGYHLYTHGCVAAKKVQGLVEKMRELYGIGATRGQRAYAREKGRANARLVVSPLEESKPQGDWVFYLLVTDGVGLVHERESLRDARSPG